MALSRACIFAAVLAASGCADLLDLDSYGTASADAGAHGGTTSSGGGGAGGAVGGAGGAIGGAGGAVGGAGGDGGMGGAPVVETLRIPADAATNEGNSGNTSPFGGYEQRFQSVYAESLLGDLPLNATITGIRFRLDSGQPSFGAEQIGNLEIRLSTSKKPPGSLSTTFAANRGDDVVTVRTGVYDIDPADYPSGSTPNGFGPLIELSPGFVFTGGPLLLEVGVTGLASGRLVDNVSPSGDQSQSVYGNTFGATTAEGSPYFDLIVVEYTYIAP